MHGINKGLIWGQSRAPDKESVNTVERLRESFYSVNSLLLKGSRPGQWWGGTAATTASCFWNNMESCFFSVMFLKLNFLFFSFVLFKSLKLHAHQVKSQQQQQLIKWHRIGSEGQKLLLVQLCLHVFGRGDLFLLGGGPFFWGGRGSS